MDEFDYEREEMLKKAGMKRANAWANTCNALKIFFFGISLVYAWPILNSIKADGLSWQSITLPLNLMSLFMTISSVVLWRAALNAESRLLFTPWKAPAYVLHFIPMAAIYCFLTAAFYLYSRISEQVFNPAIFTEFWLYLSLGGCFILFNYLSLKVSGWVKREIAATPEMRAIFPDGDRFPADESAASGCMAWVALIVFSIYICIECSRLY